MRLLLDVNVWVALLDDAHVHNTQALALIERPGLQIATCPLVENGVQTAARHTLLAERAAFAKLLSEVLP